MRDQPPFPHKGGESVINDYVRYSLQREWVLLAEIEANIAERGGTELPIERRMRNSIMRTFTLSEVDPESRPPKPIRHWGGKDLRQRAASLGIEKAYLAVFGGPSESVHGNWGDLLRHHLKSTERGFEPNTKSSPMTRSQPFYAVGKSERSPWSSTFNIWIHQRCAMRSSSLMISFRECSLRTACMRSIYNGGLTRRCGRRAAGRTVTASRG